MRNLSSYIIIMLVTLTSLSSCKKYLEAKSDATLSTPSTLTDLQAILNNDGLNYGASFPNIGSDEYYMLLARWNSLSDELAKKGHIWDGSVEDAADWDLYAQIYWSNTVLDNLENISPNGQQDLWNAIKGSALFFRAWHFYNLVQVYAKAYNPATAATDAGIPLRLNSNFNVPTVRSTVQESYSQIIEDLNLAASLLPSAQSFKTRPNKAAAYALLARTYLLMGDYQKAKDNANLSLQEYSTLLNYNTITPPFAIYNAEVIFHSINIGSTALAVSRAKIDSNLFKAYDLNDLRRSYYFNPIGDGTYSFKGSYDGLTGSSSFNGIATDEVYLIRAEAKARTGDKDGALTDLNTLLIKRYTTGTFTPVNASTADEALTKILLERRKELLFRGLRWPDLKRFNRDGANITLKRNLDQQYTLPPNDLRWVALIPQNVIQLTGIPQNPR